MKYKIVVAEDEELLLNNLVRKIEQADEDFEIKMKKDVVKEWRQKRKERRKK